MKKLKLNKILFAAALAATLNLALNTSAQQTFTRDNRIKVSSPKAHVPPEARASGARPVSAHATAAAHSVKPVSAGQSLVQSGSGSHPRYHHELISEFGEGESKFLHLVSDDDP